MGSIEKMADPATWFGMIASGWGEMGQTAFWVALFEDHVDQYPAVRRQRGRHRDGAEASPTASGVWGMILGAGVAVLLRIVFTAVVASLMTLPWLEDRRRGRLVLHRSQAPGAGGSHEDEVEVVEHLWRAARIVAVADIIMSLDNVIAIAAAAQGNVALLVIGLAVSIP